MTPLRADAVWYAELADRNCVPELQAFYDANPEYWILTHGAPPGPTEAGEGLDARPPADMPYSEHPIWIIRMRDSGRIVGEVAVATDLMVAGVTHLGFFVLATSLHGTGIASEVYAAYEAWAIAKGARWLRLGVVEVNARGHRFWGRQGYVEVCRREGYTLGALSHRLFVMVKPVGVNSIDAYLEAVPRDRRET